MPQLKQQQLVEEAARNAVARARIPLLGALSEARIGMQQALAANAATDGAARASLKAQADASLQRLDELVGAVKRTLSGGPVGHHPQLGASGSGSGSGSRGGCADQASSTAADTAVASLISTGRSGSASDSSMAVTHPPGGMSEAASEMIHRLVGLLEQSLSFGTGVQEQRSQAARGPQPKGYLSLSHGSYLAHYPPAPDPPPTPTRVIRASAADMDRAQFTAYWRGSISHLSLLLVQVQSGLRPISELKNVRVCASGGVALGRCGEAACVSAAPAWPSYQGPPHQTTPANPPPQNPNPHLCSTCLTWPRATGASSSPGPGSQS